MFSFLFLEVVPRPSTLQPSYLPLLFLELTIISVFETKPRDSHANRVCLTRKLHIPFLSSAYGRRGKTSHMEFYYLLRTRTSSPLAPSGATRLWQTRVVCIQLISERLDGVIAKVKPPAGRGPGKRRTESGTVFRVIFAKNKNS